MDKKRLEKQLQFIMEIDKMKNILRRNVIADKTKRENDAEHSWHMGVMAMILFEYAQRDKVDILRALKMILVHDLVEVYAGDTFAYDASANVDKLAREMEAADRLFGLLPDDQGCELRALWEEFDSMETPDSIYAAAIDRLQPFLLNYHTDGYTWNLGNVTSSQVYKRIEQVKFALPALWETVQTMLEDCVKRGILRP